MYCPATTVVSCNEMNKLSCILYGKRLIFKGIFSSSEFSVLFFLLKYPCSPQLYSDIAVFFSVSFSYGQNHGDRYASRCRCRDRSKLGGASRTWRCHRAICAPRRRCFTSCGPTYFLFHHGKASPKPAERLCENWVMPWLPWWEVPSQEDKQDCCHCVTSFQMLACEPCSSLLISSAVWNELGGPAVEVCVIPLLTGHTVWVVDAEAFIKISWRLYFV